MAEQPPIIKGNRKSVRWMVTLVACITIFAAAGVAVWIIDSTEPTAKREGATRKTAMLIETTTAERGDFRPLIEVMGTVRAREAITLSPRVSGEIVERSPDFDSGAFVEKGQMLLQIDPADYENAVAQRKSALHQAEADLSIEMGRQKVAQLDFELLGEAVNLPDRSLILREPQLNAARADVASARASLEQAELHLQRTTIRAPFDAQILRRNVNVGSQVAPGDDLGQLVAIQSYWVTATVPLSRMRSIQFPRDGQSGSTVRFRNRSAWEPGVYREGEVSRLIGALDPMTRLARVNIAVDDPLARNAENHQQTPPLLIDSVVEVSIEGRVINDVIRLSRDFIRENDTVWVKEDGKLAIKPVTVVFRDAKYAYIAEGLADGAEIVTTSLSTIVEGAPLRVEGEPKTPGADA